MLFQQVQAVENQNTSLNTGSKLIVKNLHRPTVMTSVRSSMFAGLMSTMLKLMLELSRCHRFTRRSSAEMYVSQSELTLRLLMWYA